MKSGAAPLASAGGREPAGVAVKRAAEAAGEGVRGPRARVGAVVAPGASRC